MTTAPLRVTTPDERPAPRIDTDSRVILNAAADDLARIRTPSWLGDAAIRLHALASLQQQIDTTLPDAVRDARDQELTWTEIGQLLNCSAATAARRYTTRNRR